MKICYQRRDESVTKTVEDDRQDFTEEHYLAVLREAQMRYQFAVYHNIPWDRKFVLWRHDIDFSINRALRLAELEAEVGVVATYFVNLHSNFYNPLEASQSKMLRRIIELGHDLGLHFDACYHDLKSEEELDEPLEIEKQTLERFLHCPIRVFSFHNPTSLHLSWNRDQYAGLVNCYSDSLLKNTSYCSDSNGYWRFRRLLDLVVSESEQRLQILTHDGHWQSYPMAPRERVLRCVYGRANAVIADYDQTLTSSQRENRSDIPKELRRLTAWNSSRFGYIDYLWSSSKFEGLVAELTSDLAEIRKQKRMHGYSASTSEQALTPPPTLKASPESQLSQTPIAETDSRVEHCIRLATQILQELPRF